MKEIEVYLNVKETNYFVGVLFVDVIRDKEVYSFKFDEKYLKLKKELIIDPNLNITNERQFNYDSNNLFGFIKDAIPDRWGHALIKKYAKEQKLYESDFLLFVDDISRTGALRFKLKGDNNFSNKINKKIPSILKLEYLSSILYNIDSIDDKDLKDIIFPGSSLGGARPKATVIDKEGNLCLAKFPNKNDEYDVEMCEKIVNDLAKCCDLNVPISYIKKIKNKGSIFIAKRFDRRKNERIPYVSMMTLLNAKDGENNFYSYIDIAQILMTYSIRPKKDLKELFKRMIFNIIIHNSDDHLRNHGMIYEDNGYVLSPLFDINPSKSNYLSLSIDGKTFDFDLEAGIKTAPFYDLSLDEGKMIADDMKIKIKRSYLSVCKEHNASTKEIKIFKEILDN